MLKFSTVERTVSNGFNVVRAMEMLPSLAPRYPFDKCALVTVTATANKKQGRWVADEGHLRSMESLLGVCLERGFTLMKELKPSVAADGGQSGPTADDIRALFEQLEGTDFTEFDALLVVIASHGEEGGVFGWPMPNKGKLSGPISLREHVFTKFQRACPSIRARRRRSSRQLTHRLALKLRRSRAGLDVWHGREPNP